MPQRANYGELERVLAAEIEDHRNEVRIGSYVLDDEDRTVIVKALRDRARWMAADINSGEKGRQRVR